MQHALMHPDLSILHLAHSKTLHFGLHQEHKVWATQPDVVHHNKLKHLIGNCL